jgi:hypothetical protein
MRIPFFYSAILFAVAACDTNPITETRPRPDITSHQALAIQHRASFIARVNPNGFETTVRFEWGTSPTLVGARTTDAELVAAGNLDVEVISSIDGLTPTTTYYYRVHASNSAGQTTTSIQSFVTRPPTVIDASVTRSVNHTLMLEWNATNCDGGEMRFRKLNPPGGWAPQKAFNVYPSDRFVIDFYDVSSDGYEFRLSFCDAEKIVGVTGLRVPPPTLSASLAGDDVVLSWNDVMGGGYPYSVHRHMEPVGHFTTFPTANGATTLTDTSVVRGATYQFTVRSSRSTEFSNVVRVTVP